MHILDDVVTALSLDRDVHDLPACFEVKGSLRISKLYAPVICSIRLFVKYLVIISSDIP